MMTANLVERCPALILKLLGGGGWSTSYEGDLTQGPEMNGEPGSSLG